MSIPQTAFAITQQMSPTLSRIISLNPYTSHLWHYTNSEALINIISTTSLRATNANHMNDYSELFEFSALFIEALSELTNLDQVQSSFVQKFIEHIRFFESLPKGIYLISLTENGNLLSQWRAYCPSGNGYSLGISSEYIKWHTFDQGHMLCKCVYMMNDKKSIITELLDYFFNKFNSQYKNTSDSSQLIGNIFSEYSNIVRSYCGIFKNENFKEEQEWRIIIECPNYHALIDYRSGLYGIVPFYKFDLVKLNHFNNKSFVKTNHDSLDVFIGPNINYEVAKNALTTFLFHKGINQAIIHNCNIPYLYKS